MDERAPTFVEYADPVAVHKDRAFCLHPAATGSGGQLRPSLRMKDGVALIVSNVIGVGIFTTPAVVANLVPRPSAMLALWMTGGCLALTGAISYAQLAKICPAAGGEYVYLSKVYGPVAGFLSGWTSLIAGFSGAVAASAVALVVYLGRYFPALASHQSLLSVHFFLGKATFSPRSLTAAFVILVFTCLHVRGLGAGKFTQNTLALLILGMAILFACWGFTAGTGSWSHFQPAAVQVRPMSWLLALIPVMFTYSGWNAAVYVSEEMHDTGRTMGPVLLLGTSIVVALYMVLNTLYLYALPAGRMRMAVNVAGVAAKELFGVGENFITPMLIVALLGAISAMTIAGPRVYFAMARDGAFIKAFSRTSARFGTPALAIALQGLWSIVLVTVGGFEQILMYTGFAIVLSSGAAVAGLFLIERRRLSSSPIARIKMIVPAVFVLSSMAIVLNAVVEAPKTAVVGALLIAAGLPIFIWARRKQAAHPVLDREAAILNPDHQG